MQDMAQLLPEFNKLHPDIKINMIFMEENDLRNAATKDVATKGGQYDIMTVGAYEVPIWGKNRWLVDLTDLAADDPGLRRRRLLQAGPRRGLVRGPAVRGALLRRVVVPDVPQGSLRSRPGSTMPERPTWDQVAEFAKQLKDPSQDRAGICLRGKPGWGEMFAPLTTVVNTFGGQWYDMNWDAQVNTPGFIDAVQFYLDTLADAGEADPVSFGFTECLNLFSQERAAMWYDATSAAGSVESRSVEGGRQGRLRPGAGQGDHRLRLAVVVEPGHQRRVRPARTQAWEFVKWATSKEYAKLVGSQLGWSKTPPGTRKSTYEIPEYIQAGGEFAPLTAKIMSEVNPKQPGVKPQPWVGIQYVTIPEFQDVGNQTSQLVADAIAGRRPLQLALDQGQKIAQRAGEQPEGGLKWLDTLETMPDARQATGGASGRKAAKVPTQRPGPAPSASSPGS